MPFPIIRKGNGLKSIKDMHSSEKAIRTRAMLVLGNPFILGVI